MLGLPARLRRGTPRPATPSTPALAEGLDPTSRRRPFMLIGFALLLLGAAITLWYQQQKGIKARDEALSQAEKAAAAGDTPQAQAACQALIEPLRAAVAEWKLDPKRSGDVGRSHRALGQCLGKLNRHAEAITELRAAIELRPEFAPLHGDLALALSRNRQHLPAQRSARLAVQLDPHIWQAHRLQARVLDAASSPAAAERAYKEAARLAPPDQIQAVEEEMQRMVQRHKPAEPAGPAVDPGATARPVTPSSPSRRPPA